MLSCRFHAMPTDLLIHMYIYIYAAEAKYEFYSYACTLLFFPVLDDCHLVNLLVFGKSGCLRRNRTQSRKIMSINIHRTQLATVIRNRILPQCIWYYGWSFMLSQLLNIFGESEKILSQTFRFHTNAYNILIDLFSVDRLYFSWFAYIDLPKLYFIFSLSSMDWICYGFVFLCLCLVFFLFQLRQAFLIYFTRKHSVMIYAPLWSWLLQIDTNRIG